MKADIGESAGVLWNYLHKHGEVALTALAKDAKLNQRQADRAIGWLAREGKVQIRTEARQELVSLKK